jgi:Flp pilus assembly pilin Flp
MKNIIQKARQRGQGMVEYIIIVAVVALGSIAVYAAFGDVLRAQVGNATDVLGGTNKSHATDITDAKTKATNNAKKDMSSY